MFKSWRNDKRKIKAVFKLQFQATQVPQLKKPALLISLVPEDVGKTTFKLEKAPVQDGTCLWENPLFVTVKLIRQPKTGNLKEKIYHFIVSSGSSKSGYLGEASIDFADFAEENEPITVSLPLKFANSGAVLHVTVQRVQGDTNQRYVEETGVSLSQDESLKNRLSNVHTDANNNSFNEDTNLDIFSSHNSYQDGSFKASLGSNASIQSDPRQNSMPQVVAVDTITPKTVCIEDQVRIENFPRDLRGASDESTEKLKSEITSLMRQSELTELEIQSLRKQFAKENRRAQDLSRQVIDLKEERDQLKTECVQLRSQQKTFDGGEALNRLRAENKDVKVQLEEIRRELSHEKELNNNLKLQLEKTQESNSELILAVNDLDEMLEQKKLEISHLLSRNLDEVQDKKSKCNMQENEDQQAAPGLDELAREKNDSSELCLLKEKITELSDEVKLYREDREKLETYIEHLTQDNAELQQENHDITSKLEQHRLQEMKMQNESMEYLATVEGLQLQVERLEQKLKQQTLEFSESLDSISELESQVKTLEKELEKQAQAFENDLDAMTCAKIEQEQRAIRSEEALRKTRWKNAITAERLQEEFRRLSVEMTGKFDENEKLMTKALTEADELRAQNRILEDRLQKANEELSLLRDQSRVKVEELSTQLELKTNQVEQMSLELGAISQQLKCAENRREEKQEAFLVEVQMLKAKIEMLKKEKHELSELAEQVKLKVETEGTKTSVEESDVLIKRWEREREELRKNFALAKQEAEKAQEELLNLRSLKNEKEILVGKLLSEAGSLRSQHIELKKSLSREELEKEHLQKQVLELKQELEKRRDGSNSVERKIKNNIMPDGKAVNLPSHKRDDCNLTEMVTEMSRLKERNKCMESELKEMQERYSEISLKFAEVEGERQQLVMTVRNLKSGKRN
ncbi:ATP binding protein, putative [Ricinus communis]|uniref:ATP binding protein, putative n=1 Tax=Ricinus communis TaxID=3988 RepID=B9R9B9_RICCO|nr:ATP binding protein, putative [Ricinus communis]